MGEDRKVEDDLQVAYPEDFVLTDVGMTLSLEPSPEIYINNTKGLTFLMANGDEVLRFHEDGRVFVRGELVDDNQAIYKGFQEWFVTAQGKP